CCHLFFFSSRRRHTRSKRDWSSDVCSSDLQEVGNWKRRLYRPLLARLDCILAHLSSQLLLRHRQRTPTARLSPPKHRTIPGIQMQRQGPRSRDRKRQPVDEFLPRHRPGKIDCRSEILYESVEG